MQAGQAHQQFLTVTQVFMEFVQEFQRNQKAMAAFGMC